MTIDVNQDAKAEDVLKLPLLQTVSKTISSGAITIGAHDLVEVSPESGTTDDLATVTINTVNSVNAGFVFGLTLASSGDVITLKHGTGNLSLPGGLDYTLNSINHVLLFHYDGTNCILLTGFRTILNDLIRVDFKEVYDNGNSGASKTINWNNGNVQKVKLTGDCAFSYTDPPGPCGLTLYLIGDSTARTPDLDNDADAEWLDNGEPDGWGSTNDEIIGIVSYRFDPNTTPKYIMSADSRGAS